MMLAHTKKNIFGRYLQALFYTFLPVILTACGNPDIATGMILPTQTRIDQPIFAPIINTEPAPFGNDVKFTGSPDILVAIVETSTPGKKEPVQPYHPSKMPTLKPKVELCTPLDNFPLEKLPKIVSAPYDPPPMGSDDRHQGVDFVYHHLAGVSIPILGVQVNSVMPGVVVASLSDTFPYGNFVIIETPGSWLSVQWLEALKMTENHSIYHLYAHLQSKPLVSLGQDVTKCQPIGKVGKSGNTEAAHLHLEMRIGLSGGVFPSMYGLLKDAPEEARKNYNLWRSSGFYQHFDPMFLLMGFH